MKRCRYFKNRGKNRFIENQEKAFELSEHVTVVEHYIFWYDQDQLALLIENFLDKKIDSELFWEYV